MSTISIYVPLAHLFLVVIHGSRSFQLVILSICLCACTFLEESSYFSQASMELLGSNGSPTWTCWILGLQYATISSSNCHFNIIYVSIQDCSACLHQASTKGKSQENYAWEILVSGGWLCYRLLPWRVTKPSKL
jgi:hypothetical protein